MLPVPAHILSSTSADPRFLIGALVLLPAIPSTLLNALLVLAASYAMMIIIPTESVAQLKAVISFSSEEDMPCLEITPAPYELEEDKLIAPLLSPSASTCSLDDLLPLTPTETDSVTSFPFPFVSDSASPSPLDESASKADGPIDSITTGAPSSSCPSFETDDETSVYDSFSSPALPLNPIELSDLSPNSQYLIHALDLPSYSRRPLDVSSLPSAASAIPTFLSLDPAIIVPLVDLVVERYWQPQSSRSSYAGFTGFRLAAYEASELSASGWKNVMRECRIRRGQGRRRRDGRRGSMRKSPLGRESWLVGEVWEEQEEQEVEEKKPVEDWMYSDENDALPDLDW